MGGHEASRALLLGPEQQHLTGMGVGSALLDVEVVAVIPAHHQAQILDWCVGSRAGADSHPGRTAQEPQEIPVTGRLPIVRGEPGYVRRRQDLGQGRLQLLKVAVVRNHHHRAPSGGADCGYS
ncbi:hypothetical protein PJL18_01383 [Paenarthrobacter nicotinovorans]|nr:hypothetical protein [Paenarthrobacter nicotinovorans]